MQIIIIITYTTYFKGEITLRVAQILNTEQLQRVYRRNMGCFRYIIVNTVHVRDNKDNNNNNTNKSCVGCDTRYFDSQILQTNLLISNAKCKVMLPGFRREADEKRALLGYYAACSGDSLPVFPDILQVLSSRANNQRILPRNGPKERNSQLQEVQTVTELCDSEDEDVPPQRRF